MTTDERAAGTSPSGVPLLARAGEVVMRGWHAVRATWQRSIQLRVITATLTLSLVVVGVLGAALLRQISDGLLSAQREAAIAEASAGIDTARRQLEASSDPEPTALDQVLRQMVIDAAARGTRPGTDPLYEVVLLGSAENASAFPSNNVEIASVPERLRESVAAEARLFSTYTSIVYQDGAPVPGLAVGGQVSAPTGAVYEMYYLFPLTEQQATIDLVRTALATAGLLIVLLLGALAWLVTRQVVTPVRMAARIAERFSAGKLSERMAARGRDDIAKLASSFNQMAASLQQQIGQLEELSRVQQQFVSDVSHELRTPLTTVRMAADVLYESRDEFDPVVERSVELLQAQLDRFESLLTDLLEISRFDAGAAVLHAEPHDIRDLVDAVADAAAPLAARKRTPIVIDVPSGPCIAQVDARRIERVLRNLVVNAVEHGEAREVKVRVAADESAVAVTVRDHGVGLKPGESSLVFHRFWRADPARARTTGGTGLGLSISLEDARLHGGWLQAWGEPGEGSQFRLTLPREVGADLTSSPLALVPDDSDASARAEHGVGDAYQRVVGPRPEPTHSEPVASADVGSAVVRGSVAGAAGSQEVSRHG